MSQEVIAELHKCILHVKEKGYFPPSTLVAVTNHTLFSRRLKDNSVVAACAVKQTPSEENLALCRGKYTLDVCISFVLENDDTALAITLINDDPLNEIAYFAFHTDNNYTATVDAMVGYLNKTIEVLKK